MAPLRNVFRLLCHLKYLDRESNGRLREHEIVKPLLLKVVIENGVC